MFSGNRVEVLNQQPDRLPAQLGKNMPFVRKMLVDHGVRVADLFSDCAKRDDVRRRCICRFSAGRQGERPFRLNGCDAIVSVAHRPEPGGRPAHAER